MSGKPLPNLPDSSKRQFFSLKGLSKVFTGSKMSSVTSAPSNSPLAIPSALTNPGTTTLTTSPQHVLPTTTQAFEALASSSYTKPSGSPAVQQLSTQRRMILASRPIHAQAPVVETSFTNPQMPTPNYLSTAKDYVDITSTFTQMLIKKLPDVFDINPVKMAFGLAKMIIEIKDTVKDNMDVVERRIASIGNHLEVVTKALDGWQPDNAEHEQARKEFESVLSGQLAQLLKLKEESLVRQLAINEENKKLIAEILEGVNEARIRFQTVTHLGVFRTVYEIHMDLKNMLLNNLQPSAMADHKFSPEGKQEELLRREVCTPGTRVRILKEAITWANDTSLDSPSVFWLTGQAGSGKTTIAYTIARRFEMVGNVINPTILGGNFLCSRQFEATRYQKCIIRTIVYQLAHKCKPFADCLRSCHFDTINHEIPAQINEFLVKPWKASERKRGAEPQYLIIIDALDEIDGTGGPDFLRDLLDTINEHKLRGLKFFATSRPSQDILTHLKDLKPEQLYRLEHVPIEEAQADITTYLNTKLSESISGEQRNELVAKAAGLFIYAATVVKHLATHTPSEQKRLLRKLLNSSSSTNKQAAPQGATLLDELYLQILSDTFGGFQGDVLAHRIQILHTFLCTAERTSTSIVTGLLHKEDSDTDTASSNTDAVFYDTEVADDVLKRLHAVLYTKEDQILWYHTSFRDFLFDQTRSGHFSCDEPALHQRLAESCFRLMEVGLKFNIGEISTSFLLDNENITLPTNVKNNISAFLGYSCRNWDHHLSAVAAIDSGPLLDTVSEFLQLHVLFWIEAMNLLGSRGRCVPMLQRTLKWVSMLNTGLADDIGEVAAFATYFNGSLASLSTPHLYISALATWSRNSVLSQIWKAHFPHIPRFTRSVPTMALITLRIDGAVVAFSSDDRHIISGSKDKSVRVWDASTGEVLKIMKGHTGSVSSVVCSSDGKQIASGSYDCSVRVWDALKGELLKVLEGHTGPVKSVTFLRNDRHIVSGADDNSVRVWDASTGGVLKVMEGHTRPVNSVACSSNGKHIVSGSDDRSVRIWDASTGEVLKVLEGHTTGVRLAAFSNNDKHVISFSWDEVRVWDAFKVLKPLERLNYHPPACSTDASPILSDRPILPYFDNSTGVVLCRWRLSGRLGFTEAAFSNDSRYIVCGSTNSLVTVRDASTGEVLKVLEGHTGIVTSTAFSSDDRLIISASADGSVRVWDTSTREGLNTPVANKEQVLSAVFSSNNRCIVSGWHDNSVKVWDASTGESLKVLKGHRGSVYTVAISSDDKLIASGSNDYSVRIWDASTGKVLQVLEEHTGAVQSVAFSSDDSCIVTGSNDMSVRLWDVLSGKMLKVLKGHTARVNTVAFSRDGKSVVSGSYDCSLRVWDFWTGKAKKELKGHNGPVCTVAFSNDDSSILSASYNGSLRVWNTLTGDVQKVLKGHTGGISGAAFSSDDRYIITGLSDEDYSVLVWDVPSGKILKVLRGHTDSVRTVAFSSDDKFIVSCSSDRSVRLWEVSTRRTSPEYVRETDGVSLHDHTGWLLSPNGQDRLMFAPPDALIPDYSNILTVPHSFASSVDFSHSRLGPDWEKCYCP